MWHYYGHFSRNATSGREILRFLAAGPVLLGSPLDLVATDCSCKPMNSSFEGIFLVFCLYLGMQASTLIHELGHLVAARALGLKPIVFSVGKGLPLLRFMLGGVSYSLQAAPSGGYVQIVSGGRPIPRWSGVIFAAAGPFMNLLAAAVIYRALPSVVQGGVELRLEDFWKIAFWYELASVAFNLYPHDSNLNESLVPNDGKQILAYLRGDNRSLIRRGMDALAANVARYEKGYKAEQGWFRRASPEAFQVYADWVALAHAGRFEAGVEKMEKLLGEERLSVGERALFLDQISSLVAVQGCRRLQSKALSCAREARQLLPDCPTLAGSLGSLLVLDGDLQSGIQLLEPLCGRDNEPMDRLIAHCYLCRAYWLLGDPNKARAHGLEARGLGPRNPVYLRLRRLLELPPQ
jgi:hypothetical protein